MKCLNKYSDFVLMLIVTGCVLVPCCTSTSDVHDVFYTLFVNNSYNKYIRPVKQHTSGTDIHVTLAIIAIVEFNEVLQMIKIATKLTLVWKDEFLFWNPSIFGNVTHIHAPQTMVWTPAIVLENSVAKHLDLGTDTLKVVINHDGTITWEPIELFHSTCAADVRLFPFDTQNCDIVFESMIYSADEVSLHVDNDHLDFHRYGGISGWTVTETSVEVEVGEEKKTHLTCSLTMSRHPTYFILNIFLPIILLSFMNICVFILPVQSGEKASFVITVFLSLAVFLTIISSELPENTENVSILNVYVFISTLLSVVIAMSTIVQIRIYHKSNDVPVPLFLKKFVIKLTSKPDSKMSDTSNARYKANMLHDQATTGVPASQNVGEKVEQRNRNIDITIKETTEPIVTWSDVAMTMDSVFLVVFLVINITMTSITFFLAIQREHPEANEKEHHHHHH